jgi:hypothetical protein
MLAAPGQRATRSLWSQGQAPARRGLNRFYLVDQAPQDDPLVGMQVARVQRRCRGRRAGQACGVQARSRVATGSVVLSLRQTFGLVLLGMGRGGNCFRKQSSSFVNQALQPVGCHIQRRVIHRALVSTSRFGALRF